MQLASILEGFSASWGGLGRSWRLLGSSWRLLGGIMRPLGAILGPLGGILVPLGPSRRRLGGVLELQNPPDPRRPGRGGGSAAATPGRIPLGLLGYKGYHKEKG